jgi:hypothetical protein
MTVIPVTDGPTLTFLIVTIVIIVIYFRMSYYYILTYVGIMIFAIANG